MNAAARIIAVGIAAIALSGCMTMPRRATAWVTPIHIGETVYQLEQEWGRPLDTRRHVFRDGSTLDVWTYDRYLRGRSTTVYIRDGKVESIHY